MGGTSDGRRHHVRPRMLPPLGWFAAAFCTFAAGLAFATPAQSAFSPHRSGALASTRDAIIACTNSKRAEHGLHPLRKSRTLRRAAQYHAGNMLRHRFFAHNDIAGRNAAERVAKFKRNHNFHYIGENIAAGYSTARSACRSWLVSSKHRYNILDPDYRWIGIGFASGDAGYGTYFVQNFGG
jgi:uncharacterized protein YkwD